MRDSAFLHVIGGNDRGKQYELVLPETRIGRGADQDVVLADIAVSRRHITVHAEGGRFRLRDLGSGNGTLVNGQRIDTVILNDGDQIELGNTLMRFDHAASRAAAPGAQSMASAAPPSYAPPPYAAPSAAPVYGAPAAAYPSAQTQSPQAPSYAPDPGFTPSDMVSRPAGAAVTPTGGTLPPFLQPLASPTVRLATLGTMGGLCLIALVVIITKSAMAHPQVVASDAEELYRQGLKLFAAKDYEGAKVNFTEALASAPESAEARRYVAACDLEVHARGAMTAAERALNSHRYGEAIKSLDAVDSDSQIHDQAVRVRKETAPKAAAEYVDEARGLQQEDPDTAKARLTQAMQLDPTNSDARQLAAKLHIDVPPLPASAMAQAAPPPPPPRAVVSEAPKAKESAPPPPPRKAHAAKSDDGELAPVKVAAKAPAAPKVDAPTSGAALTAYRNHDFATAERLYRMEAGKQPPKQFEKTIAYANQVRDMKQLVDRAAADEPKNPAQASKEYEDAMALDQRIGRGANAGFFKQKLGKLQLPAAQQAFAQGHYEQALAAALQAQKLGAGDGGMLAKLDAKAQELTNKGVAMQKSNLTQAKQYWRQVLKMVPTGSPTYNKAYQLVNNAGGPHRDEDED